MLSFVFIGGGFWLLAEAWKVLCAAQASGRLATTGPCARMRHPRYAGFIAIMPGFLFRWPTLITLVMFPILVAVCVRLARREDAEAAAVFGERWTRYAMRTPAFLPHWSGRDRDPSHG
ncbi:MAG: hypothetical protein OHK0026_12610 [Rhodocyclaceae bacterium]